MANKYIIPGATFNGDGTSSAEATSNGGVGAWSTINILTGAAPTYGALNSGDVVYIRSKTAAGADIAVESASIMTIGASGKYVDWVLDNGSVWPGIDGTLTVRHTGTGGNNGYVNTVEGNTYTALRRLAWVVTATGWSGHNFMNVVAGSTITKLHVTLPVTGTPVFASGQGVAKAIDCKFTAYGPFSTYSVIFVMYIGTPFSLEFQLINPEIEVTNSIQSTSYLFGIQEYGGLLNVIGGRVVGGYLLAGGYRLWNSTGHVNLTDFKYPNNTTLGYPDVSQATDNYLNATGCDDLFGAEGYSRYGVISSRKDGNFPTLNALLPNAGSTPWAWWVYVPNASQRYAFSMPFRKVYEGASAQLTVSLNLLVSTLFAEINRKTCYLVVSYINTDGVPKSLTSRLNESSALDASSAAWTFSSYGAVTFDKKVLSVQTPDSVKQGTMISAMLFVEATANSTSKLLIVCPDVQAY